VELVALLKVEISKGVKWKRGKVDSESSPLEKRNLSREGR